MTADGRRSRTGGGILWSIIKAQSPSAYKEIMKKTKEFEVFMMNIGCLLVGSLWNFFIVHIFFTFCINFHKNFKFLISEAIQATK